MSFCGTSLIPSAYARFGGESTPNERVEFRAAGAAYLKGLVVLADNQSREARRWFEEAIQLRPALIWAKHGKPDGRGRFRSRRHR